MLIELPTADEIDSLAITTPRFEVRKLEFEMGEKAADLDYTPCKGQVVLVIRGEKGVVYVRHGGEDTWSLPSGRIGPNEEVVRSAKRVARETCGVGLRSTELAAMYDVIWHFSDISIKRLHIVFAALTDDTECVPGKDSQFSEARFFAEIPEMAKRADIDRFALTDCSTK